MMLAGKVSTEQVRAVNATQQKLNILISNLYLITRSGTEVVVRDLALHLTRRGHRVSVFVPGGVRKLGEEIRSSGVPVFEDVRDISQRPDIIHGHHSVPTMLAMARFPDVPAVWMSHDFRYWFDEPPRLSNVRRYLPVDETRRKFLINDQQIPACHVEVLRNSVDLARIPARIRPLPRAPQSVLAFTKTNKQIEILQKFCNDHGMTLDTLGRGVGREISHPEQELVRHDVIVATGRSAMEALCAGASVIIGDARGFAGLVTSENYEQFRIYNFGSEMFTRPFSEEALAEAVAKYNPDGAMAVTERIRHDANVEPMMDRLEAIYCETLALPKQTGLSPADRRELWHIQRNWPMGRERQWRPHRKILRSLVWRDYVKYEMRKILGFRAAGQRTSAQNEAGAAS